MDKTASKIYTPVKMLTQCIKTSAAASLNGGMKHYGAFFERGLAHQGLVCRVILHSPVSLGFGEWLRQGSPSGGRAVPPP